LEACRKVELSAWLCCLPAFLPAIVLPLAIGRTPASSTEDRSPVPLPGDADELNCFARLGLLDGRPDGQIDPRDRSPNR
jgi:hypothetical protein